MLVAEVASRAKLLLNSIPEGHTKPVLHLAAEVTGHALFSHK